MSSRVAALLVAVATMAGSCVSLESAAAVTRDPVLSEVLPGGDLDGDGREDLVEVRASFDVSPGRTTLVARRGLDGHVLWVRTFAVPVDSGLVPSLLFSRDRADVLLRATATSVSGDTTVTKMGLYLLDGATGSTLWGTQLVGTQTNVTTSDGVTHVTRVDVPVVVNEDNEYGNLVGGSRSDTVVFLDSRSDGPDSYQAVVVDGDTGVSVRAGTATNVLSVWPAGVHTIDGYDDISVYSDDGAGQRTSEVRNAAGVVAWRPRGPDAGSGGYGPVADLDGDGYPEMLSEQDAVVRVHDGLTGDELFTAPGLLAHDAEQLPGLARTPAAGLSTYVNTDASTSFTTTARVLGPGGDVVWQRALSLSLDDQVGSGYVELLGDLTGDGVGDLGVYQYGYPKYSGPLAVHETLLDGASGGVVRSGGNGFLLEPLLSMTGTGVGTGLPVPLDGRGVDYRIVAAEPHDTVRLRGIDGRTRKTLWDRTFSSPLSYVGVQYGGLPTLRALAGSCGALLITTGNDTTQRATLVSGRTGLPVWSFDISQASPRTVANARIVRPGVC